MSHISDLENRFAFAQVNVPYRRHPLNLRGHLRQKISSLKKAHDDIASRLQKPAANETAFSQIYFSSWHWVACHLLTSIPNQSALKISNRLAIPVSHVERFLEKLRLEDLVYKNAGSLRFKSGDVHLPKNSPLVSWHHQNWRQKGILDSQSSETDGVNFTAVQTISLDDFLILKNLILNFIQDCGQRMSDSEPMELVAFNVDFFRV